MRNMKNTTSEREARRMRADQEELAERIARATPSEGTVEVQPGLHFRRCSRPTERLHSFTKPSFCVIAQGSKELVVGDDHFRYDPAHYMISTVELPMIGQIVEASPERPYLGFWLVLEPSVVTSVMVESGAVQRGDGSGLKSVDVSALDGNLLDATLRLVRLVDAPAEYRVLAPLVIREIVYRLLTGAQAGRLRHLATFGGHAHRMVRAVEKFRMNFNKPLRIEEVARELGMSVSGFHAHFRAVTAMSPLQFQKQLRLQEARRLMLSEDLDAAEAGYRVGYDDASHFSREYKRHFGEPPMRDVGRMRELATA
ncbi:MAG: AraC family transcriptional regulator CmrA [Candidatus Rokuibacteriota bacterium]|nr:MAG: AraC family transcriptional regulator CmrA [Candidatus Rokubacteria bacterium]PYN80162.1 MAG: AraC family transcriptional regulator CmrA [Candidatus Rokubacteria bacterium]